MAILNAFVKGISRLNDLLGEVLAYLLFLMFFLLLMEVARRYLLNSPTVWANELTQMLFGAYVVLSGGYILVGGGHVNVDILYSTFTRKTRAKLDIATSALFFLFCGMLLYYGGSLAWESLTDLEHSQSAWNPPLYPVKLMIPLGALLLVLQGIAKLILDVFVLFDIEPPVKIEVASHAEESL